MPWDIHWPSSSFQSMPCDTIRCTTRSSQGWDDGEEGGYVPMPHPRQERNMEEGMPGVSWFSSNPGHSNNKKFSFYRFISSLKTQGCGFKSDFSFSPPKNQNRTTKIEKFLLFHCFSPRQNFSEWATFIFNFSCSLFKKVRSQFWIQPFTEGLI